MKTIILFMVTLVAAIAEMILVGSSIVLTILLAFSATFIGLLVTFRVLAFFSRFMKERLTHDPDHDSLIKMFVRVDENRQVIIEREGNPLRVISGGKPPKDAEVYSVARSPFAGDLFYSLFQWYENYIFNSTGLYAYVPYFTKPRVMPLPRYRVVPRNGNNVYIPVEEGAEGYFTNHVRNAITTWYFKYEGLDIEGIPFIITGSLQYRIDPNNVRDAMYFTDAWNVLLDQSAITVIRSTVRDKSTIDKVIGMTSEDNWAAASKSRDLYNVLSRAVLRNLTSHTFGDKKRLSDIGIVVLDVLFNDFEPQLTDEEKLQLRAPALQQRVARGQQAIGKAVAANQAALIAVHKDGGDTSDRILAADALVRASQGSGGLVEALLATFVKNNMKK